MINNKSPKEFLIEQNFVPSKKMGQNFLVNENVQKRIVSLANINNNDCVLEIGPGLGAISKYIIEITKNYVAIELDKRLFDYLTKTFDANFINNDVLKQDLNELFLNYGFKKVKVVANLPYSISSQIILKLLKNDFIDDIIILVQKEMAQRLLAKVNTKDYNAFTVLVNLYADVSFLLNVSHKNFFPQPKVESWLIKIKKKGCNLSFSSMDKFLKTCFLAKRKKLINNLSNEYNKDLILSTFKALNINSDIRAESLTGNEFVTLYEALNQGK